ncbi:DUF1275 domain-containing protein [Periweissella cryptocerci]|uniref:DUF1275 domain-containing protein n=1 Tax=Periweissella cryptocerci TaxID=2506420 RepID=A0A4P6YT52_9LACO|nr:YoaK family protein [Periweissella cryptocerci]QBO35929.1 DUF1275 domain-containing protein [Periweissella cryptocerci]
MHEHIRIQDTLRVAVALSMVGGYMDSYSYSFLGEHFASLQSGNLIMMGMHVADGQFQEAATYLIPVLSFALGAGFNFFVKKFLANSKALLWQEISLLIELLGFILVATIAPWLPSKMMVIGGMAFFAALQADTFTVVHGTPYATLMSTGNVKTFGSMLMQFIVTKDKIKLYTAGRFFVILFGFFSGAVIAHILGNVIGVNALYGASFIMLITFLMLHIGSMNPVVPKSIDPK